MIASLKGTIDVLSTNNAVIDVGGVGYSVAITPATASELRVGQEQRLLISMIVREDAMLLFGFPNQEQREFFDLLRGVNGVGPKLAMAVLATLTAEQIAAAVANEDDKVFSTVSGIGPKTAKLLVVTLAGRLKTSIAPNKSTNTDVRDAVISALTGLGITERVAAETVDAVIGAEPGASRDATLRAALAHLGAAKANRS